MDVLIEIAQGVFNNNNIATLERLCVGCCPEWDSVGHFSYLMAIEDRFGIRFSIDEIAELKTVEEIHKNLVKKGCHF